MNLSASEFNERYPVRTAVLYWPVLSPGVYPPHSGGPSRETRTRSKAWALGDGHAVVQIDGLAGCVSLLHLEVAPALPAPEASTTDVLDSITAARQEECIRCPYCEHVQDLDELPEYDLLVTLWGYNNGLTVVKVCCEECEEEFLVRENVARTFDVAKTVAGFK